MKDKRDKRPMKVGILTFACDAGRSGIGQYLIHLLREFPKIAPDVEFEVVGHEDEIGVFLPPEHNCALHTISSRWESPVLNILWQSIMLPGLCRAHGYDVAFLPAANRRLPLWLPCPSVGTVHDFSSMHITGKYDPLRDVYIKRVLPFLVRRLTRVLTESESAKQDIVHYAHYPAERIRIIPLGVDHDTYYPRDKEESQRKVSAKYGLRPPYILYISRIEHPGKNHVRLIRAFAQLKRETDLPHQLVLAGSDWNRAEEVHKAADATGLGDAIRFTGFVDGADLPDLYCGADLFVFPSLFEGFGMPILEAMACGVPVACANVSSLPEVAGDAAAYFNPSDEQAITDTLGDLLGNRTLREQLAESGQGNAAEYRWSSTAEATLKAITTAARSV
jgi:glycosyltransferase involved in cell wall biosynthesis